MYLDSMKIMFIGGAYKLSHNVLYQEGTNLVISNWTPTKTEYFNTHDDKFVHFGHRYLVLQLENMYKKFMMSSPNDWMLATTKYRELFPKSKITISDWERLKYLGYLPIKIKAIPEGTVIEPGTPVLTVENTHPDYYWLPNYLETFISQTLWLATTNATYAREIRNILLRAHDKSGDESTLGLVEYQVYDISANNMGGNEASIISGLAHLNYFKYSNNSSAIITREHLYNDASRASIQSLEHPVIYNGSLDIDDVSDFLTMFPTGNIIINVSQESAFDIFRNIYLKLKNEILYRNGKTIISIDGPEPLKILFGKKSDKGLLELLSEEFGVTLNSKGYKVLNPAVGVMVTNEVDMSTIREVLRKAIDLEFVSTNIMFGIGALQYQHSSRKSLEYSFNTEYIEVMGKSILINNKDNERIATNGITCVYPDLSWAGNLKTVQDEDIREFIMKGI